MRSHVHTHVHIQQERKCTDWSVLCNGCRAITVRSLDQFLHARTRISFNYCDYACTWTWDHFGRLWCNASPVSPTRWKKNAQRIPVSCFPHLSFWKSFGYAAAAAAAAKALNIECDFLRNGFVCARSSRKWLILCVTNGKCYIATAVDRCRRCHFPVALLQPTDACDWNNIVIKIYIAIRQMHQML